MKKTEFITVLSNVKIVKIRLKRIIHFGVNILSQFLRNSGEKADDATRKPSLVQSIRPLQDPAHVDRRGWALPRLRTAKRATAKEESDE